MLAGDGAGRAGATGGYEDVMESDLAGRSKPRDEAARADYLMMHALDVPTFYGQGELDGL